MKDTEVKRLLYQDSEAFKAGIEVGRKEVIEKACHWLKTQLFGQEILLYEEDIEEFRKAMEE